MASQLVEWVKASVKRRGGVGLWNCGSLLVITVVLIIVSFQQIHKYIDLKDVVGKLGIPTHDLLHLNTLIQRGETRKAYNLTNKMYQEGLDHQEKALPSPPRSKNRRLPSIFKGPIWKEYAAANRLERQGNYMAAAHRFVRIVHRYPKWPFASRALLDAGDCYLITGHEYSAEKLYRKLEKDYPKSDDEALAEVMISSIHNPNPTYKKVLIGIMMNGRRF